jgi:hypothetical protein
MKWVLTCTLEFGHFRLRTSPSRLPLNLDPIRDASIHPTRRRALLAKPTMASITDTDAPSTEDAIGQPFEVYGLVHIEYFPLLGPS